MNASLSFSTLSSSISTAMASPKPSSAFLRKLRLRFSSLDFLWFFGKHLYMCKILKWKSCDWMDVNLAITSFFWVIEKYLLRILLYFILGIGCLDVWFKGMFWGNVTFPGISHNLRVWRGFDSHQCYQKWILKNIWQSHIPYSGGDLIPINATKQILWYYNIHILEVMWNNLNQMLPRASTR